MNFLLLLLLMGSNSITLTSPEFATNTNIPVKYTHDGKNISPPLKISGVPQSAVTLALVVDDPDGDKGVVTHWIAWNIAPTSTSISENTKPGTQGKNEKGELGYMGPNPPTGAHHYHFTVYAIDKKLDLSAGATKDQLLKAIEGHILASGELIGIYEKKK